VLFVSCDFLLYLKAAVTRFIILINVTTYNVAADGRTLLSLKCPNKETMLLWSDGVDVLLQGVGVLKRMSQAHQVHSYTHPRELFAVSEHNVNA
jgi:hypothetical protein